MQVDGLKSLQINLKMPPEKNFISLFNRQKNKQANASYIKIERFTWCELHFSTFANRLQGLG